MLRKVVICVLFHLTLCNGIRIQLPYYICQRNDEASPKIPGICSSFVTQYVPLTVVHDHFTQQNAIEYCTSDDAVRMSTAMSDAMADWSLETCVTYVFSYADSEIKALKVKDAFQFSLNSNLKEFFVNLDGIIETFGDKQFVEGNIWRHYQETDDESLINLNRKRYCLLTTLVTSSTVDKPQIAEIGYNAGHSAASILLTLPTSTVTSFDLCMWPYALPTHEHLKSQFGERTKLVCGDSAMTLPQQPNHVFDVIFIDGGHLYHQALVDIRNAARIVKPGGIIIVDDCESIEESPLNSTVTNDVFNAWRHAVGQGVVIPFPQTCGGVGLCIGRFPS